MRYSKELKIGVFVVSVLVATFFVVNFLRGEDILNREYDINARFENVDGLIASAPVYIKGYKVGKVYDVIYDKEKGDFVVQCSIQKDFIVPEDSQMTIYAVDIMGAKGVRIELGNSEENAVEGDFISSAHEIGLIDALSRNAVPLIENVNKTLDSLNVTIANVNSIFSHSNQENIRRTFIHLEKTLSEISELSSSLNGKSEELTSFIDNLQNISFKLDGILTKADTIVTDASSLLNGITSSDIDNAMDSLNSLLDKLDDPDGTIGKLLVEDGIYDSFDQLLFDVDELILKIKENPKKYLRFSLF